MNHWLPKWAKGAVIYQIFPERFYNANKSNDPPRTKEWGKLPVTRGSFYGGDLEGIIQKIPYLAELGIDAIYLTPIFKAPSNHKYDVADYFQIDPHFGTLETLKELVNEAHRRNIKLILDGVFGHCGKDFFAFQDVLQSGPKSRFVDWFYIRSFPIKIYPKPTYEACFVWWLPRLRTENPEVKKYLFDVVSFWMDEAGIDGWRLDVADEIGHEFWKEFRKLVKGKNPEAIIIGEIWYIATPWLQGDEFDSVMNYPFRQLVVDFFAHNKINVEQFNDGLEWIRKSYPPEVNHYLFNLIGSHDTPRFLTLCRRDIRKMMLAVTFQFTYPGMPVIYYGDERGMTGGADPDCRRCMDWGELSNDKKELFELYKKLIALRKNHKALKEGEIFVHFYDNKNNVYSYLRKYNNEEILIILHNSARTHKVHIPCPENWNEKAIDLLSHTRYIINEENFNLTLKPYAALILKKE